MNGQVLFFVSIFAFEIRPKMYCQMGFPYYSANDLWAYLTSSTFGELVCPSLLLITVFRCVFCGTYGLFKSNNEISHWRTNRKIVLKPLCTHTVKLLCYARTPHFFCQFKQVNKILFVKRWNVVVFYLSSIVINFSRNCLVFAVSPIFGFDVPSFSNRASLMFSIGDVSHTHYSGNINSQTMYEMKEKKNNNESSTGKA